MKNLTKLAKESLNAIRVGRVRLRDARMGLPCITYIGAHGQSNLGDDAMFEAALGLLRGCTFSTVTHAQLERKLAPVHLGGDRFFQAAILGGGTLINPYWWHQVVAASEQEIELWALGTGVGSCGFAQPPDIDVTAWAPILGKFKGIGVRGPRSKATLESMGVEKIEVVGDLALALAQPAVANAKTYARVAINVTRPSEGEHALREPEWIEEVVQTVRSLRRAGLQIVPVAMHPSDLDPLRYLLTAVGEPQSILASALVQSHTEFFQRVQGCHFTIAVRLHAAVLSTCIGVPPILLSYRDKCMDFMSSMTLDQWCIDGTPSCRGILADRATALAEQADEVRKPIISQALLYKARLQGFAQRIEASVSGRRIEAVPCGS